MNNREGEPLPGREGVVYFGGVAAGLSHEISNILNIINELAGLQHDIAAAAAEGGDARVARIADLSSRIKAQVTRGEEVNRRLHGFAHSVDDTTTTIDLAELLALLAFLEARPARLGGVELAIRGPQQPVTLYGDPFALLLALHGSVTAALRSAGSGGRVEVAADPDDGGASIRVGCSAAITTEDDDSASMSALRAGAATWGASVSIEPDLEAPRTIVLTVPATAAAAQRSAGDQSAEEAP